MRACHGFCFPAVPQIRGCEILIDKNGGFLDVCTYVDGKRNGKSVSFDEDGNVVIRLWRDGEMVGERVISD